MEGQAALLYDQDTLRILVELGVGVEEVASDDTPTHASADDDDSILLFRSLLRRKLEPQLLECTFNELEDEILIFVIVVLDNISDRHP